MRCACAGAARFRLHPPLTGSVAVLQALEDNGHGTLTTFDIQSVVTNFISENDTVRGYQRWDFILGDVKQTLEANWQEWVSGRAGWPSMILLHHRLPNLAATGGKMCHRVRGGLGTRANSTASTDPQP